MKKKQFWYKVTVFFFLTAALVACGKKEESAQTAAQVPPVAESRSVNPESHIQGIVISDTAAYASADTPTVFGLNLVDSAAPEGAVITSIVSGSQATRWDLQPADIIVKVGNTKIANKEDFKTIYDAINSGMTAEVTLLRDNHVHEVGILKL